MKKTGGQVLNDVCKIIESCGILSFISGKLYKNQRPVNSRSEDIVVSFKTGLDGQFQEGAVTINIYVPDIDNGSGTWVMSSKRCTEIEALASSVFIPKYFSEYYYSLGNMIQTFQEPEIGQHFIHVDLRFKRTTF